MQEMQKIVDPLMLDVMNKKGQKPQELFTESHKYMVKAGEKWMQKTATSCTVVGALIVTIIFAAIITVPGGNDQSTGLPMFLNEKLFMLFIICDALSLLSSSTSVLMFLGILTSRYAEEDFLESLPRKMIIGLSTLILPFHPYLLHCNHDDNLLCFSFHYSTWKIMGSHSCHLSR